MARLPIPGSDDGLWGDILNNFLRVEHNSDGTLKSNGSLAAKADDSAVVHNSGAEVIAGQKTFSSAPVVPNNSFPQTAVADLASDLTAKTDKSTLTAKGDLYAATTSNTPARVAVGSDGQVLTADSAVSNGVKWAGLEDPYAASVGLAMLSAPFAAAAQSHTLAAGTAVFVLIRSTKPQQVTTLGVWIKTAAATPNGVNGMALFTEAGVLIEQTSGMSLTSAGYIEGTLASTVQLSVATYYIALLTHYGVSLVIQSASLGTDIPVVAGHYPSVFLTSQTSFPSSFTPSSATRNSSAYVMGAR